MLVVVVDSAHQNATELPASVFREGAPAVAKAAAGRGRVQPVVRLVLGLGDYPLDLPAIGVDLLGGVERIRILRVDVVVAQVVGIDLVRVRALGEGPVPPGRVPSSTSWAYGEMPTEFVLPKRKNG